MSASETDPAEPREADRDDAASSPHGERRSVRRRGPGGVAGDVLYGVIRWIGSHVRGLHAALGVYLLGSLVAVAVGLGLFVWIAYGVMGGATQRFDQAVVDFVRANAAPVWDWLGLAGAALGSGVAMWVVLILGTLWLWRSRHHYSVLLLWVALLGGRVLNHELKVAFGRPRPEPIDWQFEVFGRAIDFPTTLSFPSGHATTAMVMFGTIAYLVVRLEHTRTQRRWTLAAAALLILLIGLSRIYLGVHYPSDVIAGYLSGLAWATLVALGIEVLRYFRSREPGIADEERDLERGVEPIRDALRAHPEE
jgi:undecaprenyl-diphosphatase